MSILVTLFLVSNVMTMLIGVMITIGFQKLRRWGKALMIWIEPNTRQVRLDYCKVLGGKVSLGEKEILLEGNAKHGGKQGTWLVDPNTGWNFVAPTRQETFDKDLKYAVLEPSNPASYHKAIHRRRWDDILRAGEENDKWAKLLPTLGVIALIALVIIMGTLVWIASKIGKVAPAAGG